MRVSLLISILLPLSQGCLSMKSNPPLCATCPDTLANTNLAEGVCDVHRTCVSCTKTDVRTYYESGCLRASVSCPSAPSSPRIRLLKTDNHHLDIVYDATTPIILSCTGVTWRYTDPTGKITTDIKKAICFGTAEGFQQSPIDLETSSAVHTTLYDASQFKVEYGTGIIHKIELMNSALGFHVEIKENVDAFFTASHLDARYRLVQYHGHWNKDINMQGSEHTINKKFFPAEFHFVHIREDFLTLDDAIGQNGVAVIAVLAEKSTDDNPLLKPLIDAIANSKAPTPTEPTEVDPSEEIFNQNPAVLIPIDREYLAYTGSLTTGLFQKCVAWNVLKTPITISQAQLNVLAKLFDKNNRPIEATKDGTTVYTSEKKNNRRPLEEEENRRGLDSLWIEPLQYISSSLHNEKNEEEEEEVVDGIEFSQEELEFFHRLRMKYNRKMKQLRSKLLEWTI